MTTTVTRGKAPAVAVIQFPGSNCEYETARAVADQGMEARVLRWNDLSPLSSSSFEAFVLPGGFSFQDRVRAGAVASKEGVMDLVSLAASRGRPLLGICNGAQILVESGLVPGWEPGTIQASLAGNISPGRSGYLSRWIHLTVVEASARTCPWLCLLNPGDVFPMPIAHAEGRFVFRPEDRERALQSIALRYSSPDGGDPGGFPWNPNGSWMDAAGMINPAGNILALMPHPERACRLWQVPPTLPGEWGGRRRRHHGRGSILDLEGPGALLFAGLARSLGMKAGRGPR